MSKSQVQRQIEFMVQFREALHAFLTVKRQLMELEAEAGLVPFHSTAQGEAWKRQAEELAQTYNRTRHEVAKRIVEAKEISDRCEIATKLTILPPGGYPQAFSIYEVVIQEQLPAGFEMPVQRIGDAVDQTIFALERKTREPIIQSNNPKRLSPAVAWWFPKEYQRAIFSWALIGLIIGLILRFVFGIPLERIGELIVKWLTK